MTFAGAPEGVDARLLVDMVSQSGKKVLHICSDDGRMAALEALIEFHDPKVRVITIPAWDCLPYDRVSPNADIVARRLDGLGRLAGDALKGSHTGRPVIVLTTVNAVIQRVMTRKSLATRSRVIKVGDSVDTDEITRYLVTNGFNRVGTVMEPGDVALRGGLVDIFAPGMKTPVRLDLFGDEVDSVRTFDPATQRTLAKRQKLALLPATEIALDEAAINAFRQNYRATFTGANVTTDPLYESVSAGRKYMGMEHWLPLFSPGLETIFDYVPDAPVTLDPNVDAGLETALNTIQDHYDNRAQALKRKLLAGEAPYRALEPTALYVSKDEWATALSSRAVGVFSPFEQSTHTSEAIIAVGGRAGRTFAPERTRQENVYDALVAYVKGLRADHKRVILAAYSAGSRDRLMDVLREHGLVDLHPIDHLTAADDHPVSQICVAVLPLETGYEDGTRIVISEQDILGDRLARPRRKTRRAENFLQEVSAIEPGDLVVHVEHGVGRFEGLSTLDVGNAPHDCLMLSYADGDKLYVPVENIEILSRYGASDGTVPLDKLGGAGWQNRRAKLKKRLKDMADELIKIAAERQLKTADKLEAPEALYQEFCARFPYQETDDQLRAIDQAVGDLSSGRPMDRLVCGDVGFGKTEVALRTAFQAVMSGKQVAVVVPTTLLARQHYRTFAERFEGLPVNVRQLSRLVTGKDATATRAGLTDGSVDIVVGTHALLSKSVAFDRLGLLIVDEEQNFGVKHKERLKQLKADVHVLTLSATPIPRTLQLALTGVKELSLIATPPVDRLAVRTFVMPHDPVVIREALLREHVRGGQSFFVCPRIQDLEDAFTMLQELVPEVKVCSAHGRMPVTELEDVMNAFYDRKYDVLLSTNIVESGLDIPTANTMIVHRADMFGLANLYQLRGRIGRSKTRGYAYLTTPAGKVINSVAEKRLGILQTLDTLGAGFTLASHDLDLRGSGNLLGEEQSGHIREVGFELYQSMLEEAVAHARAAEEGGDTAEIQSDWSPQINVGVPVMLPEDYIGDLGTRMSLYRRLSDLDSDADIQALASEMIDRFGPLPEEAKYLLQVVAMKQLCRTANLEKVDTGPKGAVLSLRDNAFPKPEALIRYVSQKSPLLKIRPDQKIAIVKEFSAQPLKRIKEVRQVLEDMAKIAA